MNLLTSHRQLYRCVCEKLSFRHQKHPYLSLQAHTHTHTRHFTQLTSNSPSFCRVLIDSSELTRLNEITTGVSLLSLILIRGYRALCSLYTVSPLYVENVVHPRKQRDIRRTVGKRWASRGSYRGRWREKGPGPADADYKRLRNTVIVYPANMESRGESIVKRLRMSFSRTWQKNRQKMFLSPGTTPRGLVGDTWTRGRYLILNRPWKRLLDSNPEVFRYNPLWESRRESNFFFKSTGMLKKRKKEEERHNGFPRDLSRWNY